jgi:F-type H+-transporting ATPase subunit b
VEHGAEHLPSIADLFWPAINFAIFAFVVVRFLAGPIREYFRERTERLRDALAAGRNAKAEAAALRAELDKALADLPALRERLKADLRATAEAERDALLRSAQRSAERIRQDARVLAEQEVAAARRAVRLEVVDEAIREATRLVREALGPGDQERFVREFVDTAGRPS